MIPFRPHLQNFGIVCAVAFCLRSGLILAAGPDPRIAFTPDSASYLAPAENLTRYGRFAHGDYPDLHPETERTPGYPLFLAIFSWGNHIHPRAVQWAQVFLGSVTAGLLYMTGMALWNKPKAAFIAGLGLACDVVIVAHTGFILTETPFLLAWTLAFLSLILAANHKKEGAGTLWLVVAGMGFGSASLIRPAGLYYFVFVTPLFIGWLRHLGTKRAILKGLIFFIAALIIPGIWVARNFCEAGLPTFSSTQGQNLYLVRASLVDMQRTGHTYEQALKDLHQQFQSAYPTGFLNAAAKSSAEGSWAAHYLLRHPVDYLLVFSKETVKLFGGNSMKVIAWLVCKDAAYDPSISPVHSTEGAFSQVRMLAFRHPLLGVALFMYIFFITTVYVLAVYGFYACWTRESLVKALFVVSPAVYIVVVTLGAGAHARYRIPAMPALFLLAGFGSDVLLESHKSVEK